MNSNGITSRHDQDIELAARVHYSFLPQHYSDAHIDIAVKARPLSRLGGDYCSIFPLERRLIVCMCDVVGHGVAAALFAARVNAFVLSHACDRDNPCHLIESLNDFLCRHLSGTGLYTSFFAVYLDFERNELEYAGAGHPPLLHYHGQTGDSEFLQSGTTILGIEHPLPVACALDRRKLHGGDKLLLYTDGLMESHTPQGQHLGTAGLEAFTRDHHTLDSATFNERLFATANCFDCQIKDDVLIMTMSIK